MARKTLAAAVLAMLASCWPISAAEFQVTTEVFVGEDASEPSARNTTLFRGNIVYDYSLEAGEITIFNAESGRFILLDQQRRIKTELSTRELLAYAHWVRTESKNSDDKLLRFCASPQFDVAPDESKAMWSYGSSVLTYRVQHEEAADEEIASQYRTFCDWFARLNSMTNPGGLPPFARMEVNAHLEQNRALPKTVYLNVAPHPRFGKREYLIRSEHRFRSGLTASDLAEIEKAERHLVTFREVALDSYRPAVAATTDAR